MSTFATQLRTAAVYLVLLTAVVGIAYPLAVTVVAQVAFPAQANGSFVRAADGRIVGSALIGQAFSDTRYLWSRPSAAGDGYDANASSASNLAPTSETLIDRVAADVERYRAIHGDVPVPIDLVTASGSGLDPHISPAAATYQVERIAAARGIPASEVQTTIERHTIAPFLGVFGEPSVSVLLVNLDLDGALAGT